MPVKCLECLIMPKVTYFKIKIINTLKGCWESITPHVKDCKSNMYGLLYFTASVNKMLLAYSLGVIL